MAHVVLALITCFLTIVSATYVDHCTDDIFADPDSCDHFYKCDNGKPVLFTCPSNLFYNTETKGCDWPSNVKCDANTGKRPDSGTGSSKNTNFGTGTNNGNNDYNPDYDNLQFNNDVSKDSKGPSGYQSSTGGGGGSYDYANPNQDQDTNVGPSRNSERPPGPDKDTSSTSSTSSEEMPRHTVDDLYTEDNNPYEDVKEHERNN